MTFIDKYFYFWVLACMMFFWPDMMAYKPQEMVFQYGVFIMLALSMISFRRRECVNRSLVIFFGFLFLNTILRNFEPHCRMMLMNVFLGILAIKLIADHVELDFKRIATVFEWACIANVLWLTLQVLNVDPLFTNVHKENMPEVDHVGFMGARFALGCMGALVMPFILNKKFWHIIIVLPLIWFSKSSTVMLVAAVVLIWWIWVRARRRGFFTFLFSLAMLTIAALALSYILLFDFPTGQWEKRLFIWFAGIKLWAGDPWLGHGLGEWARFNVLSIQANGMPEKWLWAHNEYLQLLVEGGFFAVVLLVSYLVNLWRTVKEEVIKMALLALLMISLFHFPFHIARLAGLSIFILGLAEAVRSQDEEVFV